MTTLIDNIKSIPGFTEDGIGYNIHLMPQDSVVKIESFDELISKLFDYDVRCWIPTLCFFYGGRVNIYLEREEDVR